MRILLLDTALLQKFLLKWGGYLLFLLTGCVTPYDFDVLGEATALVVDATLTNEEKAHTVKLTLAENLDSATFRTVSGASVAYLSSDQRIALREAVPGVYVTDSSFSGIPGNSYQLEIILENGQEYLSTTETLPIAVPIDSIYARYLVIPNDDNANDLNGVQIFLDAHGEGAEPLNFRYEYLESYAIDVPFPSQYYFQGFGNSFEVIKREAPLERCYRTARQSTTIIATTKSLSANRIAEQPIRFISESLPELAYAYRIGVRQYTITNKAFEFYKRLRENNEGSGSLSDRQLGRLTGNISGSPGAALDVLGYFEVAGVSEVRMSLNAEDFLKDGIQTPDWVCPIDSIRRPLGCPPFGTCTLDWEFPIRVRYEQEVVDIIRGDTVRTIESFFDFTSLDSLINLPCCRDNWRITNIPEDEDFAYFTHRFCSDCTTYGAFERPEVWEDIH
ncbi:MAG: DUF4249 domain-containing protein [Cytophagales bacterium]|nr:DUF4249 domain-containing protein [Cytophagales bacterium]